MVALSRREKLAILADAAKYDASYASSWSALRLDDVRRIAGRIRMQLFGLSADDRGETGRVGEAARSPVRRLDERLQFGRAGELSGCRGVASYFRLGALWLMAQHDPAWTSRWRLVSKP